MSECHVYIETSLRWPHKGDGIVGIVLTDSDDTFSKTVFGIVKDATPNSAILMGIKNALGYLAKYDDIHLHLSCAYVANNFDRLPSWEASSWMSSRGEPIKNKELWQEIAEKVKGKRIKIHLNEFNGYRNWLIHECDMRGRRHGFIL